MHSHEIGEREMPLRGALGLSTGNQTRVSVRALNVFAEKKPCRSFSATVFLPVQPPVKRQQPAQRRYARLDPLYLFYCGLEWRKSGETASGWELVQAMRSSDRGARALAAELLAETEDGRLLVRDLRRTRGGLKFLAWNGIASVDTGQAAKGENMITPYGLPIVEDCMHCPLKKESWFCHLSGDLLGSFSASSHLATYPGGAILFIEGQMPRGAFVLCSGKVKLSTTSRDGKVLIVKMAEAGEVLGLSAVISGTCYGVTAETASPCQVNFIERETLLRL